MTTLESIKDTIAEVFQIDASVITHETHLTQDLHLDGFDVVELIGHLEETLHTEITDEEVENMHTVADLASIIEARSLA